jgi:hypothetical protein
MPTPDEIMAAIDAALQPAISNVQRGLGPGGGYVTYGDLQHFLGVFRQAVSVLVYGPPAATTGESLDVYGDQVAANKAASVDQAVPVVADQAVPVVVDQAGPVVADQAVPDPTAAEPLFKTGS